MPLVSFISREQIELQHRLISTLEEKCSACEILQGHTPSEEYLYDISGDYYKEKAKVLAFAQYDDLRKYAIYIPGEWTTEQLSIFELFLREVKQYAEADEQIIVFSKRDYDAIMKYNYGPQKIDVKLYVL